MNIRKLLKKKIFKDSDEDVGTIIAVIIFLAVLCLMLMLLIALRS